MTKTVWIFEDERFDDEDKCRACIDNAVRYRIDAEDCDFRDWINSTFDGFSANNYWYEAWDILREMGADFMDFADDYADYVWESEVEMDEEPIGYVFALDEDGTVYETEDEARTRATNYASETFYAWLDKGRETKVELSAVLANALDAETWRQIYDEYLTQCIIQVRTAESEDMA